MLWIEQLLNGLQYSLMLFLFAAGLTLVFGIMNLVNLAHGSLYMLGAYSAATLTALSGSYAIGLLGALLFMGLFGAVLEIVLIRRLYRQDHLTQVLATFALILISNESVRILWGVQPLPYEMPPLDASDPKILVEEGVSVQLPRSSEHHLNWIESVRSREQPLAPAPVAHRSNSACIVSWIAMKLGRPLNWDVKAERFVNDDEANAMLSRPERDPYGAHRLIKAMGS